VSELATVPSGFDPVVVQRWTERFARFAQSGLSVAAFCKAQRIAPSGFFRWRNKLASPDTRTPTTRTRKRHSAKTPIVPLRVAAGPISNAIELVLANGTLVRFPPDTRPEYILAIVRGLESPSC
jgi:hypothetical protein